MNNDKPSFKVVDILPFKDENSTKSSIKAKKEISKTNVYAKYLDDQYESSEGCDLTKPIHYKKKKLNVNRSRVMKEFKEDFEESRFDDSIMCYEGGSRKERSERSGGDKKIADTKGGDKFTKSTLQAGEKVKNLFNNENVLGHTHLQKVGDEMQKHGSKEKTGFMEKEADFVKELKDVQNFHINTCITLLKVSIGLLVLQFFFACFCIFYFGCGFGDCQNNLICCIHFIKFVQTLVLINTYSGNIKERQPNHPIGTLNSFLVFLLYYCCLYSYIPELIEKPSLVHFCVVYPLTDGGMILISFIMISKVKAKSRDLIENKRFKEYNQEAEIALADILYLPQEFESDDGEEDF